MFLFTSKKRKISRIPLPVTYIVAYSVYFIVGYFVPNIPVPSLTSIMIFVVSVLSACAVFAVTVNRTIFNCVAGWAVQNLAVNICNVFFAFVKMQYGWSKFFVKLAIKLAIYVLCYFVFAKKSQKAEMTIRLIRLYIMSLLTIVITSVMFSVVNSNGKSSVEMSLALTLCCLLALMFQFSEFRNSNLDKERVMLETLLHYEQKQHELTQGAIDLINIKCHDLKKQVMTLKELLGDEAGLVLGDIEDALSVYEDMVNTGNKNLDLIISEEKLYCNKYGIVIDVMADGAQLDFMDPADIYSLFSNALSNAAEGAMCEQGGG